MFRCSTEDGPEQAASNAAQSELLLLRSTTRPSHFPPLSSLSSVTVDLVHPVLVLRGDPDLVQRLHLLQRAKDLLPHDLCVPVRVAAVPGLDPTGDAAARLLRRLLPAGMVMGEVETRSAGPGERFLRLDLQ